MWVEDVCNLFIFWENDFMQIWNDICWIYSGSMQIEFSLLNDQLKNPTGKREIRNKQTV